jgi:thiol-disulfide isomerase/thioredoxin
MELLVFTTDHCPPCRMMHGIVDDYLNIKPDAKISILNVKDRAVTPLVENLGIRAAPTLVLMSDGKEVKRHVGVIQINQLKEFMQF